MSDTPSSPGLFAERLEHLFQTRKPEDRKKLSNQVVADTINEKFGAGYITMGYIWHLRKGVRDNPSYRAIRGLAWYFGVQAQYFFDEPDAEQLDAARSLAMMADGLSETAIRAIESLIKQARTLENLPPAS